MGLQRQVLARQDGFEMRAVVCRPRSPEPSAVEEGERAVLVVPVTGILRLHLGRNDDFLVDPVRAIFLPPGVPHRYSHPAGGGDDCIALEFSEGRLRACLEELDPAAADRARPSEHTPSSSRPWRSRPSVISRAVSATARQPTSR